MVTHQHWFCQICFETVTYNANLTHAASGRSCTSQTHFPEDRGKSFSGSRDYWLTLPPHSVLTGQFLLAQRSRINSLSSGVIVRPEPHGEHLLVLSNTNSAALQAAQSAQSPDSAQGLAPCLRTNPWG